MGDEKTKGRDHLVTPAAGVFGDEGLSDEVCGVLSGIFNKNSTVYDRAIDASYNSGAGSSVTHHITDGSHTFWGAFNEAAKVRGDAPLGEAASASFEHLMRDLTAKSGINPVMSMSPENLERLKDVLSTAPGVTRSWVNDILTVNVFEAAGAALAAVGAVYGFSKNDYRFLGRLVGASSYAALVSANPLMAVVGIVTAARAWKKAGEGEKGLFKRNILRGGLVSAVVLGVSSMVGGPAIVGIATGLYAGYVADRVIDGKKCDDPVSRGLKRGVSMAVGELMRRGLRAGLRGLGRR